MFSSVIKTSVMLASNRHCCLCGKSCGTKIEIHHIKPVAKGGQDTFENAAPLCFDCHAEVGHYNDDHPRGTKYSASELRQRRDDLYGKIAQGVFGKPSVPLPEGISERDMTLLRKITTDLPMLAAREIFKNHDFHYSMRWETLKPARDLWNTWDEDIHRFQSPILIAQHKEFHAELMSFYAVSATLLTLDDDRLRHWYGDRPEIGDDDYDRYDANAGTLNVHASKVWNAYIRLFDGTPVVP